MSSDPNILTPQAGGSERANALLMSLAKSNNVTALVFSWHGDKVEKEVSDNLKYILIPAEPIIAAKEKRYRNKLVGKSHDLTTSLFTKFLIGFNTKLKELISDADYVVVDQYAVGVFLKGIEISVPIIYNAHNFELNLAKQRYPLNSLDIFITKKMESFIVNIADTIITCSDKDLDGIYDEYLPKAKMFNINNGANKPKGIDQSVRKTSKRVIFVGSGHPPNNTAVENIVQVAKKMPELDFVLMGDSSQFAIKHNLSNVFALGKVSDKKLDEEFKKAFLFLNPMEVGSGSHLKIAKSLSYELPIVTSLVGSRGFDDDTISSSMVIANTTEEIVDAINKLKDKSLYHEKMCGAKESFKKYDWNVLLPEYVKIITEGNSESISVSTGSKKKKVLLYSIIRNEERFINKYYENIKKIVSQIKDYEFYISIYENDSTDKTKQLLMSKDWSFIKNFSFITETLRTNDYGSVKDPDRVKNLSIARNKAIEVSDWIDKVDYVMMIESDFTFSVDSVRKLLNFEKAEPDFDIVSAISIRSGNLYDAWATRKTPVFVKGKQEIDADWKRTPYGRYYSTSNGICLYRAKPFQEGARYGWINKVTNEYDCDTVIICQDFYDRGYRNIFIMHNNPVYHEHH